MLVQYFYSWHRILMGHTWHTCQNLLDKLMVFSSRLHLIKLATLNFLLYIISTLISYINSCNVHVLYKMIFSNKLNLFWTSLFLSLKNASDKRSSLFWFGGASVTKKRSFTTLRPVGGPVRLVLCRSHGGWGHRHLEVDHRPVASVERID